MAQEVGHAGGDGVGGFGGVHAVVPEGVGEEEAFAVDVEDCVEVDFEAVYPVDFVEVGGHVGVVCHRFLPFPFCYTLLVDGRRGGEDKVAQTGNRDERDGDGERQVDGWSER